MHRLINRWSLLGISALLLTSTNTIAQVVDAFIAPLASKSLLLDLDKKPNNSLVAVGERGHILLSDDGKQWQQSPVPTQATLTSVNFVDNEHGWAVGHDATILATSDGGKSWLIQQQFPELEKPLMDVQFFDRQHGIAIGSYGLFYRTQNGGKSWLKELHAEVLLEDDQLYLEDLKQEDESLYLNELSSILPHFNSVSTAVNGKIYLAGEAGLLAVSSDYGRHWQRQELDYYGSFFTVEQSSEQVIAAGLRGSVFILEEDEWQKVPVARKSSINNIVKNEDQALLVGNNGVYISLNAELQVVIKQTEEGQAILDAAFLPESIITVTENGISHLQR